ARRHRDRLRARPPARRRPRQHARRGHLERGAAPLPHARRHELRTTRGARRHPVAVLGRRSSRRAVPARTAVGARGREARAVPGGAALASRRRARRGLPAAPHDRTEARVVQHRRADEPVLLAAPRRRRGAAGLAGRRRALRPRRRRPRAHHVAPRRGRGARRLRHHAAARARVHEPALPRARRDERADDRRDRPALGHGGVQGDGDPRGGDRLVPDLRLLEAEPSDAEREASDAGLGAPPAANGHRTARAERDSRHLLLPALRAAQRCVGWVSEGALGYATRRLSVPPAEAYGVASFYALLSLEERPADVTHVCTDLACALRGATVGPGEHASPCLGLCERAPAKYRTVAGPEPFEEQLPAEEPPLPQAGDASLRLLRRIGAGVDPTSLDAYVAAGGLAALARARELGPEGVVAEVTASRLLGRGGAAFPTGQKWRAVLSQPAQPHYVVCNADESEPGTFKDRVLMEQDPFALVEAIAIA